MCAAVRWSRSDFISLFCCCINVRFFCYFFFHSNIIMINSSIGFLSHKMKSIKTYYFSAILPGSPHVSVYHIIITFFIDSFRFERNNNIVSFCAHAGSSALDKWFYYDNCSSIYFFFSVTVAHSICLECGGMAVFYYFNALHRSHSHTIRVNINGQFLIKLQLIVFFCCILLWLFVFRVTFKLNSFSVLPHCIQWTIVICVDAVVYRWLRKAFNK